MCRLLKVFFEVYFQLAKKYISQKNIFNIYPYILKANCLNFVYGKVLIFPRKECAIYIIIRITTIVYCVFICTSVEVQIVCKKHYDTLDR